MSTNYKGIVVQRNVFEEHQMCVGTFGPKLGYVFRLLLSEMRIDLQQTGKKGETIDEFGK